MTEICDFAQMLQLVPRMDLAQSNPSSKCGNVSKMTVLISYPLLKIIILDCEIRKYFFYSEK
jgi:hypothetical protein